MSHLTNQINLLKDLDIVSIRNDLKIRGYAFVNLDDDFIKEIDDCEKLMADFFNSSDKESYFRAPVFGYFNVPHKEVFRFVTGTKIDLQSFPNDNIKNLGLKIDNYLPNLAEEIFPNIRQIVATHSSFDKWGLLDIVLYNNLKDDVFPNKLNIVEHYDAGILTFSFRSTAPGLELRNEFGEWISPPDNVGILWTGHAIKLYDPLHPEGVYRVQKNDIQRMGIWYEICTFDQERNDILNKHSGYQYEIDLMKKEGYVPIKENGFISGYKHESGSTLIGFKAMEAVTTGSNKVAIGRIPVDYNTTSNIYIGSLAGEIRSPSIHIESLPNTTGSPGILIGALPNTNESSVIPIG